MIAYLCTGPEGTCWERVRLRLVIYTPFRGPATGKLKCVVQAMKARTPVAEDPLAVDYLTPLELVHAMSESRREGWVFEFDHALAARLEQEKFPQPQKRRCRLQRLDPIPGGRETPHGRAPRDRSLRSA